MAQPTKIAMGMKSDSMVLPVSPLGKVFIIVKDGFMDVYGMVGSTLVRLKVRMTDSYGATKARLMETLLLLKSSVANYQKQANERVLLVKTCLSETSSQISCKVVAVRNSTMEKALQTYARARESIESIPVVVRARQGFTILKTQVGSFVVYVKSGFLKIYGTVGDVSMRMKLKIVGTGEAIQAKALETVTRVTKAIEAYTKTAKSSLMSIKGRVGDTVVSAKSKVVAKLDLGKANVAKAFGLMKKTIEDLPLTAKITDGMNMVRTKVGNVVIYVKDGYIYAASKVGDIVVYIKAQVVHTHGVAKLKIIEKYTTTKSMILSATDGATSTAVSASQLLKAKVLAAVDASKGMAAQKPVAASAAGGAVLGGAGGGAAGLASGGLLGAACGVPFALFTFGLSVPVGAAIGGSVGACVGATAGGAAGAVGGSAAGVGFEHRAQIKTGVKSGMEGAMKKVTSFQDLGTA